MLVAALCSLRAQRPKPGEDCHCPPVPAFQDAMAPAQLSCVNWFIMALRRPDATEAEMVPLPAKSCLDPEANCGLGWWAKVRSPLHDLCFPTDHLSGGQCQPRAMPRLLGHRWPTCTTQSSTIGSMVLQLQQDPACMPSFYSPIRLNDLARDLAFFGSPQSRSSRSKHPRLGSLDCQKAAQSKPARGFGPLTAEINVSVAWLI